MTSLKEQERERERERELLLLPPHQTLFPTAGGPTVLPTSALLLPDILLSALHGMRRKQKEKQKETKAKAKAKKKQKKRPGRPGEREQARKALWTEGGGGKQPVGVS